MDEQKENINNEIRSDFEKDFPITRYNMDAWGEPCPCPQEELDECGYWVKYNDHKLYVEKKNEEISILKEALKKIKEITCFIDHYMMPVVQAKCNEALEKMNQANESSN